ncbi:vif protein [Simian immunodeficiency virus]|uniref:Virion infectivity factor n=1 Tax=Simian immunodeficiency virus TaxID=11723 RepID=Q699V0_SIV|nr:vif protein [Simian immunodeficiency virus]
MEKEWIVVLTWKLHPNQIDKMQHILKVHKYKSKQLEKATYKHHYQITWEWWTRAQWEIPVGQGVLIIKFYHNLTPEKGLLRTEGVGLIWAHPSGWSTEVTPQTADALVHSQYFPCFSDRAVQQALRGEKLTSHCWNFHKEQVLSLQYLALQKYLSKDGTGFLQSLPAAARGTTILHSKKCQLGRGRSNKCHCQSRTGSPRSMQAFYSGRNIWSLESMLRGGSRSRRNTHHGLD